MNFSGKQIGVIVDGGERRRKVFVERKEARKRRLIDQRIFVFQIQIKCGVDYHWAREPIVERRGTVRRVRRQHATLAQRTRRRRFVVHRTMIGIEHRLYDAFLHVLAWTAEKVGVLGCKATKQRAQRHLWRRTVHLSHVVLTLIARVESIAAAHTSRRFTPTLAMSTACSRTSFRFNINRKIKTSQTKSLFFSSFYFCMLAPIIFHLS